MSSVFEPQIFVDFSTFAIKYRCIFWKLAKKKVYQEFLLLTKKNFFRQQRNFSRAIYSSYLRLNFVCLAISQRSHFFWTVSLYVALFSCFTGEAEQFVHASLKTCGLVKVGFVYWLRWTTAFTLHRNPIHRHCFPNIFWLAARKPDSNRSQHNDSMYVPKSMVRTLEPFLQQWTQLSVEFSPFVPHILGGHASVSLPKTVYCRHILRALIWQKKKDYNSFLSLSPDTHQQSHRKPCA